MAKEFMRALVDFISDPKSQKYEADVRLIALGGTAVFFALPAAIKNVIKSFELVICDLVYDEHQNICHKNFQDANIYVDIFAYSTAISGELYLARFVLD